MADQRRNEDHSVVSSRRGALKTRRVQSIGGTTGKALKTRRVQGIGGTTGKALALSLIGGAIYGVIKLVHRVTE